MKAESPASESVVMMLVGTVKMRNQVINRDRVAQQSHPCGWYLPQAVRCCIATDAQWIHARLDLVGLVGLVDDVNAVDPALEPEVRPMPASCIVTTAWRAFLVTKASSPPVTVNLSAFFRCPGCSAAGWGAS